MLSFSLLVSAFICACVGLHVEAAPHASPNLRIINGKDAEPHVAPYLALVVVLVDGVGFYCGGTLIHQQFVLTAASCLSAPNTEIDRVGFGMYNFNQTEPVQERQASSYALHEGFVDGNSSHNLALIKLDRPVNITAGQVETAELPPSAAYPDKRDAYEDAVGTLYGWGATSDASTTFPHVLQALEIRVQSWTRCQHIDPVVAREDGLCVGRSDDKTGVTCSGDDGGPLVVAGMAVGVLGWRSLPSCAENPVTFVARVDYHLDWIKDHMSKM